MDYGFVNPGLGTGRSRPQSNVMSRVRLWSLGTLCRTHAGKTVPKLSLAVAFASSSSMLTSLWQSMVHWSKHVLEQCAVSGACWRLEVLEPNGDGFTKGLGLGGLGMAVHSGFNT